MGHGLDAEGSLGNVFVAADQVYFHDVCGAVMDRAVISPGFAGTTSAGKTARIPDKSALDLTGPLAVYTCCNQPAVWKPLEIIR
jgi:hypothetical protein